MITVAQHILNEHGGNKTAFARSVNASRPLVYRWIASGALWADGRVHDPVTAPPQAQEPFLRHSDLGEDADGWWLTGDGQAIDIVTCCTMCTSPTRTTLNAADLAAMTKALNK